METILTLFGIIAGGASIIALPLAFVLAKRSDRHKLLVYDITTPLPLANVLPDKTGHRLSILYEREGAEPLNVKGAYLRFVQLCNFGREPIMQSDIAPHDPLRLEIAGSRVLDITVAGVTRQVTDFQIMTTQSARGRATIVPVTFDFLDYQDGAIIRILTDRPRANIRLKGTIVGDPEGPRNIDQMSSNSFINSLGCAAAIGLELVSTMGGLYIYNSLAGGLTSLWLSLIPIGALFFPPVLVSIIVSTIWPKGPRWPKSLGLPDWFVSRHIQREEMMIDSYQMERHARSLEHRRSLRALEMMAAEREKEKEKEEH